MEYRSDYINTRIRISKEEANQAKLLAKSRDMTFQGWIGQLIRTELRRNESKEAFNDQASAQSFAKRLNRGEA